MKKQSIQVAVILVALTTFATPLLAHNWGCWKQPNRTVYVRNTASNWSQANAAINEWHNDTILNMVKVNYHTEVSVYDGNYGATGWGGLASIESYSGCNILHGHARVNTYYGYTSNGKRGVFCQEIGHLFGLDHSNDGGCMGGGYYYSINSNYNVVSHNISDIYSKYIGSPALTTGAEKHAAGHEDHGDVPSVHATWFHNPRNFRELLSLSATVVKATVRAVIDGDDIVMPIPGTESEVDRIPTQRILFEADRVHRGSIDEVFELFHTGNETFVLGGDPPYEVGETYMLFLQPREDGSHLVVSPEGRFRVRGMAVEPMSERPFVGSIEKVGLAGLELDLTEARARDLALEK